MKPFEAEGLTAGEKMPRSAAGGNGLFLTAAAAINSAAASLTALQVRRLSIAERAADPAGQAAALDALNETLGLTARLHMAQLLRMTAGCPPAAVLIGGIAARRAPPEPACRLRGRGQGKMPAGGDPYAGGLAILQADVHSGGGGYLCYSAMRGNRMLILIARPGTLRIGAAPGGEGRAARVTGKGTLICRRQDGPETRRTGWLEVAVRHGKGEDSFAVTLRPAPECPPTHASGRVAVGPADLTLTG